jgi:hypothetical protein
LTSGSNRQAGRRYIGIEAHLDPAIEHRTRGCGRDSVVPAKPVARQNQL